MPDHLWWDIMKNFLPMEAIFNLIKANKQIKNITRGHYFRTLSDIKEKQREEKFLENRAELLKAWELSEPKINEKDELVFENKSELQRLFRSLHENLQLSRAPYRLDYDQRKLEKWGCNEVKIVNLRSISGRGCWAFADKEDSEKGMLIVPKVKGERYFEDRRKQWESMVICECISFWWEDGVKDTLWDMKTEDQRRSRYLVLDGEDRKLTDALEKIDRWVVLQSSWQNNNANNWLRAFERIWM